ncbi:RNA-directed DNA polymerase from mobile element jockey [Trichonephila clavipes]|nr:RNA-directed DNA polymerase from mobile element jockey [Trichonephila clavipes]
MLTSLDTDDGSLWGLARSFRKKRSPIPTLKGHTTIAYSDTEKAETLADSLENQFKLNDISNPQHDKNHTRLISRFFTNDNNFDDNPTNPKPSEILTYINKLKIRKAPILINLKRTTFLNHGQVKHLSWHLEGKEFRTRDGSKLT